MQISPMEIDDLRGQDPSFRDAFRDALNRDGWIYVRQSCENACDPLQTLKYLSVGLGKPIHHKLSNEYGVHPIRYIPGYPEYANANVEELGLHTDGSFEQSPPVYMLIHCERPAISGGDSTLASGDQLYLHLKTEHPEFLAALQLPEVFSIVRDDRRSSNSVFKRKNGVIKLAYRSGNDVHIDVRSEAADAFEYVRQWLADPANRLQFKLQPNETLVFDNTRMLHGRTAFDRTSQRALHGLWCDGRGAESHGFQPGIPLTVDLSGMP